ncbi:MAG TPA: hypothetical protein VGP06_19495 [Janthinobacterium sp.]|nr:hypothetical protein [Janthinobacterium sp.]
MSSIIAAIREVLAPALHISLASAAVALLIAALLVLFKPLLRGIAPALLLVVKPKLKKEERLARRLMRDATMLNSMLNAMDGTAPSHAAELRALAARA